MIEEFLQNQPQWRMYADLLVSPPAEDEIREKFLDASPSFLRRSRRIVEVSEGVTVTAGAIYWRLREEGESARFSEMVALQSPPRCMSDRELFEGFGTLDKQFSDPLYKKFVLDNAKRRGFVPGNYDVYMPSLARYPGDPEAFVPPTGGRGHIKKICEQRGWAHEGCVTVKGQDGARNPLDDKDKKLAPDLVAENMRKYVEKNPGVKMSRDELRHTIIEKHGG